MTDTATEREIASQLDDLVTAARTIPVTPEHREAELIAEFLQQLLTAMNTQEALRALVDEYRRYAVSVEAQLAAERDRSRQLRLTLRQLASGWSRCPDTSPLHKAGVQLSTILDADR